MANIFHVERAANKITLGTAGTTINIASHTASTILGLNAAKNLESITVGTGLDYTRPNLTLSHLGIEALVDPGADKVMFWDDSVTACKWLGVGNSIAITDVTIDTIQDIRTTASPQFAGGTFTGVVTGINPTTGVHLATKEYVDLAIGASADYFLSDNDDAVIADYHVLYETDTGEVASTLTTDPMGTADNQLMFSYITPSGVPGVEFLRAGVYICRTHLSRGTGDKPTTFYWTLSKYTLGDVETVLITSEESTTIPDSMLSIRTYGTLGSDTAILDTDRLVLKLYANVQAAGGDSEVTIYMEGTNDCHITNLLPSSIWQNHGDVLDDLNTVGVVSASELLVGMGAGVFAWQSGATLRTTIGLGTGNNVQFDGLGIGEASVGDGEINITGSGNEIRRVDMENTSVGAGARAGFIARADSAEWVMDAFGSGHAQANEVRLTGISNSQFLIWARRIGDAGDYPDLKILVGSIDLTFVADASSATLTNAYLAITNNNELRFYDDGANYVGFEAPALTGNQIWVLPDADGGANEMLKTDGGGNLSWTATATPAAHTHDGDTLQLNGVNSDGGAFSFTTAGVVTFSEGIAIPVGKTIALSGHMVLPINNSVIGCSDGSPQITFDDTNNQIEITGGLTGTTTAAFDGASITIGKASTTTGTLVLHDSGSANTITLTVPDGLAGSLTFTLPPTDGANTNVLQTNGSGVLTWAAAGGGSGFGRPIVLIPQYGMAPAANFATLDTIVGGSTPAEAITVLDFDADASEYMDFKIILPDGYEGGGLDVVIISSMTSDHDEGTPHKVRWEVAFAAITDDNLDINADQAYDFNGTSAIVPSEVGEVSYDHILFSNGADMDSLAAGGMAILRIYRDHDHADDNATGDAELHMIKISEN